MNYLQIMDRTQTLAQLKAIGHAVLMDTELAQPRHAMATMAAVYRDNFNRLKK